MGKIRCFLLLIIISFGVQNGYSQSDFHFKNEIIQPGKVKHFTIPISDGNNNTFIPVSVFNGVKDGSVLGITTGVHGYEYPPIIAGQKLIQEIDPSKLKGVVLLVQVANIAGFSGRSPYTNPIDNKNLNRSFPGNKNGSVTDRIAYFITNEIIAKSDYFLDIHAGDAPEDLMAYSAYYSHDSKTKASEKGKKMAAALGFDYTVVFNTTEKVYMKPEELSLYCSAEAFKRGIPSVDIECGGLGMAKTAAVDKITNGVLNMLKYLQMKEGTETTYKFDKTPITIQERSYISSTYDGIFYSAKESGSYVVKGMKLGHITDYFGKKLTDVYATSSGILLLIIGTPPINKEETIAVIGRVD